MTLTILLIFVFLECSRFSDDDILHHLCYRISHGRPDTSDTHSTHVGSLLLDLHDVVIVDSDKVRNN